MENKEEMSGLRKKLRSTACRYQYYVKDISLRNQKDLTQDHLLLTKPSAEKKNLWVAVKEPFLPEKADVSQIT